MRLTFLTSFLFLFICRVWAHLTQDAAPETISATSSPIETVIPNRSYLLKLDCISCPYLIRRSNRNEWEKDPRPNQLTLALYIDGPSSDLYLQGEPLNPLWYERRMPQFYGQPYPWAPPFAANQIGANATLQQEENQIRWGIPIRQFELAYEFTSVTHAPTEPVWEREVLIEFEITGLRHEEHMPEDIPFRRGGSFEETKGVVPGVTSIVRMILKYTAYDESSIEALELMPKEAMAKVAGKEIEVLRKAAELRGNKSITTANWGGRLRDINGPDMFTEHVSFEPGEWNDCGRKDEWGRQIMCMVDDFKAWSPVVFVMSLVLVAAVLVAMSILVVFVSWIAIRFVRGQKVEKVVTAKGEDDALLLFGDEELEEEDEEKTTREDMPAQTLNQAVPTAEEQDSEQFGPYQHNIDNDA